LRRFSVIIAGVVMNLLMAWALFTTGFLFGLPAVVEDGVEAGVTVTDRAVNIVDVLPKSAADVAGIQVGDRLLTIDGKPYSRIGGSRCTVASCRFFSSHDIVQHGGKPCRHATLVEELGRNGVGSRRGD
jgi:hypothetical protein